MIKSKEIIWFSILEIFLVGYILSEIFFIINSHLTPILGITKNIFYVYIAIICVFIFLISIKAFIDESSNSESFMLGGSIILVLTSIYSILQLISHILLVLPPITSDDYMNVNVLSDFSFIVIIAALTIPFLLKYLPGNHLLST